MKSGGIHRERLASALAFLTAANAALYFVAAVLHLGVKIPLGFVTLGFPEPIPAATVVEGVIGAGLAAALAARPDAAVVDIEMPAQDGISAAFERRRRLPSCRTLILPMYGKPGFLQRAIEGDVSGFMLKDSPVEALASAIRRCAAGENVVDPSLAAQALRAGPCPLSLGERDILAACAEGASTAEMARHLCLSEGTVWNKVSEILGKIGARNRGEAARIARENGWL